MTTLLTAIAKSTFLIIDELLYDNYNELFKYTVISSEYFGSREGNFVSVFNPIVN